MAKVKVKVKSEKKDSVKILAIFFAVVILGVLGLVVLRNNAKNNRIICSFLGRLWERKAADEVHTCYTYEEFYSMP